MGGACGTYGGENTYSVLVRERKGKKSFGRPCCRWEDNTNLGFKKLDVHVAQDTDQYVAVVNLRVP
jgi:hypothetical protein